MFEQRLQFERTAKAQEALAKSQALLAEAQFETIRETAAMRAAQHGHTIATLEAALATIEAGAFGAAVSSTERKRAVEAIGQRRQALSHRIDRELELEGQVDAHLQSGAYDPAFREKTPGYPQIRFRAIATGSGSGENQGGSDA